MVLRISIAQFNKINKSKELKLKPTNNQKTLRQHKRDELSDMFYYYLKRYMPFEHFEKYIQREYKFDVKRKWRFDYADVFNKYAFEIEGGVWSSGRHNRAKGFINDCYKYNSASSGQWTVFRLTIEQLKNEIYIKDLINSLYCQG